jgi:hypothetical protein
MMTGSTPASISLANSSSVLQADLLSAPNHHKNQIQVKKIVDEEKNTSRSSMLFAIQVANISITFNHLRHWEFKESLTIGSEDFLERL